MQQWRPECAAMTFDEVSMERSKSFVKALQELKNLRPQLYSAADYCEKSYLHNEQKQMVLDNLKDYAVRALVNAVDHLGTVAYKLTDLYEQQTTDVSTVDLKISCLNQRMLSCQTYMEKEGLRQQQITATPQRHHKHYILPSSVGQKMQNAQLDAGASHIQAKPRPHPPGTPASKTLSWHLASENNPSSNGVINSPLGMADSKAFKMTSEVFHMLEPEEVAAPMPLSRQLQSTSATTTANSFRLREHILATVSVAGGDTTYRMWRHYVSQVAERQCRSSNIGLSIVRGVAVSHDDTALSIRLATHPVAWRDT